MAKLTSTKDYTLQVSHAEAQGLRDLLGSGTSGGVIRRLGLTSVYDQLSEEFPETRGLIFQNIAQMP